MKLYLEFLFVIFELFFYVQTQIISKTYLLPSPSLLNTGRDGFLLLTLNTGENTTICNYKFTEADANVACRTLGYAALGISLVNPDNSIIGPVLIGDVKCVGTESNLNLCIHSGRKVFGAPCSTHKSDVYLQCLKGKEAPVIPTNVAKTTCNATNGAYTFSPSGNKKNTGYIKQNNAYVCNDDYSVTIPMVVLLCKKFCDLVNNPLPVILSESLAGVSYVRLDTTLTPTAVSDCFPGNALALQCGEENQIIEPSPNVICTNQNITATWMVGMVPTITPQLLSSPMPCNETDIGIRSNTTYAAFVEIDYKNCTPIVTSDATTITYSYRLTRAYEKSGITSTAPRNITISCTLPKADTSNNNLTFNVASPSPLNSIAVIPTSMIFYTDSSFQALMPFPYQIFDNQLMYVKVRLESTVNTLRLGLVNCKISTESKMEYTNDNNSLSLISQSCQSPSTDLKVAIYPLNRKEVGFSFKPYVINGNIQIYVLCETTKCYMDTIDGFCLRCNPTGKRRKRRALITDTVVLGPVYVFN